jgi:diguanylate cyclase (GGDEF)-like protein
MQNRDAVHLRKYLTGIVGNAPFGIITLSATHEVGIINVDAVNFLGHGASKPQNLIDIHFTQAFSQIPELLEVFNKISTQENEVNHDLTDICSGPFVINIKIRQLFNGSLIIIEDVTKQHQLESRLRHQASHDSLTKLANRQQFDQRLDDYIIKACQHDLPGAVIYIDLDRFKIVNDTAGHTAGDELLQSVSKILHSNVRSRDLVARIGGDEFAVLLEDCQLIMAEKIAEAMRDDVQKLVFHYGDFAFNVGLSAGIAAIDGSVDQLSSIFNAADNACQTAKKAGRNRVHTIVPSTEEFEDHKQDIDWRLKINKALLTNAFILYAQEIFPINKSLELRTFELFVRLQDDHGHIIPPSLFIPSAERYDLMSLIDRWVLENSFALMDREHCYAINISGQSTTDESLGGFILGLQQKFKITPSHITFEISETAAIHNSKQCSRLINFLKDKGFKFTLDDFGAGMSSFSYLKNVSINYLKIDSSFIINIANEPTSYAIVKAINEVGHAMNLKTIAGSVEDEDILRIVQEIGIDYAQGYHMHKPQLLKRLGKNNNIIPISSAS